MGEVYRARDELLHRDVAIKVLAANTFTDKSARGLLVREARSAAALNHPNICGVFEVGEQDGQAFIAMEYVEGEALSTRIAVGPLSPSDVIRYGLQLSDALTHAHDRNIVHRDLKPGNTIITPENHIKVLDFGLARRVSEERRQDATTTPNVLLSDGGKVMGTPAYMAPEQLRGMPADARSDIWALGVMLYEMVSGSRPFEGQTWPELSAAILSQTPGPLPAHVPIELRSVIARCLAKDPGQRYQRATDVHGALEAIRTGAAPSRHRVWLWLAASFALAIAVIAAIAVGYRRSPSVASAAIDSLAVLPLANLSGDAEQDYLADGVQSALIGELARIRNLRVISRTSMLRYRKTSRPIPEIARELHVAGVVEGSVVRDDRTVRIQLRLIDARGDERPIWSNTYTQGIGELDTTQREIVREIAQAGGIPLRREESERLRRGRRADPDAYEAYLRGMVNLDKGTPEAFRKGLEFLHGALEKDPASAAAWAALATGYSLVGHAAVPDAFVRARAAANRALQLDPSLAEAHAVLANISLYWDWDVPGSLTSFERAFALDSGMPMAHHDYSWALFAVDRNEAAYAEMRKAKRIDPFDPWYPMALGWQYRYAGNASQALAETRESLEIARDFPLALVLQGDLLADGGEFDSAIAAHRRAEEITSDCRWALGVTYARAGRRHEAQQVADALQKTPSPMNDWGLALIYAALGERDPAFRWLNAAVDDRWSWMPWVQREPGFRSLRSDPRFEALLGRIRTTREKQASF